MLDKIMKKFESENLSDENRDAIEKELAAIIDDKVAAEKALYAEEKSKEYEEAVQAPEPLPGREEHDHRGLARDETCEEEGHVCPEAGERSRHGTVARGAPPEVGPP